MLPLNHSNSNNPNTEIEEEGRAKYISRLDFFKNIRASVEEVLLGWMMIMMLLIIDISM